MLPLSVGLFSDPFSVIPLIAIGFFIVISVITERESKRFQKAETETLATTYDLDATYDAIVKQCEEWHQRPFKPRRLSFASLRLGIPRFTVIRNNRPRLYGVIDRHAGIITFELNPIEGGGTIIKIAHSPGSQALIESFNAKMPIRVPPSIGKACPKCKKIYPPIYTHCPYCGISLP